MKVLPMRTCLIAYLVVFVLRCALAMSADSKSPDPASGIAAQPREPWTTSRLHGTPTPPEALRLVPAFPHMKFDHPTSLLEIPGTNRVLVAEIGGKVFTFPKGDAVAADLAVDLQDLAHGNVSLFAAVLHPQFQQNRFVYLCCVHPENGSHTRLSRFEMTNDAVPVIDPKSETVIITWPSGGHNAGCMRFGNDGLLFIATGDGSGPNPPDGLTTGQDVSDLLGAILRIDVDHPTDGRNYSIPAENPFVTHATARPEIFAYGLRNPWKFGIDRKTGEVYVADNGWETWEMIYLVGNGTNCGWPIMEGRALLRSEVAPGPTPITPPIRDHHHSEANSVIGGPVYRGDKLKTLDGEFIYGDYITGTIWSVGRTADGSFVGRTLVDTDLRITDFMEGTTGELYVLDYDLTGQIYELLPNDVEDLSADFPRLLSQTGIFQSMTPLLPAAGVVEYDVVVPQWTDGAVARRFVAVPGVDRIELAPHSGVRGRYPEGTVFAKQLSIPDRDGKPTKPLETQILHLQNGVWNPYSYLWNDVGTDAELVSSVGTTQTVQWPDANAAGQFTEHTWHTNAINECRLCHNAGPGFVLGFVGNQLSRLTANTGSGADQLESLLKQEVITTIPLDARSPAFQLVDPHDETLDLNDRARSYLHGNCSMCHHKGGNAIVSFFLTRDLSFDQMITNKGTNIGTFGMQNAKIIVPGDPLRSVMMYRMSKLGYARMPYIGSQVVDSHGVSLIANWIQSLPRDPSTQLSDPLIAASSQATALASLALRSSAAETRTAAIQQLTSSTEGSLALMVRLHSGDLTPADRETAVETVRNASSDVRGLFDHFVPESQRKKTLGRTFEPSLVLSQTGDPLRGRLIFFSDAARCRACHHTDEAALSVGPTLKEISKKYMRTSELLQHIVQPSLKIDDKFATWTVVTKDGRVLNGLMESQSAAQVVLRMADRQLITIAVAEIDELQKSSKSLMPDGVFADLTAQEAADLLGFIRSMAQLGDLKLGSEFVNSVGQKFVYLPPGTFEMGSPTNEAGRDNDEGANGTHTVTLTHGFFMAIHETTQGAYNAVTNETPWKGEQYVREGEDFPATYVSWDDANGKFIKGLNEKEKAAGTLPSGWEYCLPTEAQWEYAARAGTSTRFSFGDDESQLTRYAWFDKNAWDVKEQFAHQVGQKLPNTWGLHDMMGNCWEWTSDYSGDYPSGKVTDPTGPNGGSDRVSRGGGFDLEASYCRPAFRYSHSPGYRHDFRGFRPALVQVSSP